jgi:hypothetical protein
VTVKEDDPETLIALPSYNDGAAAHMAPRVVPKTLLGPVMPPSDNEDVVCFVLQLQINFIPGGLLLVLQISHSVCDGSGFVSVIEELARNTSASGNQDRDQIAETLLNSPVGKYSAIQLYFILGINRVLESHKVYVLRSQCLRYWTETEPDRYCHKIWDLGRERLAHNPNPRDPLWRIQDTPRPHACTPSPSRRSVCRRIFAFKPSMLRRLRDRIRAQANEDRISIYDVIVALVWAIIVNVREQTSVTTYALRRFMYPIEVRRRLGIPNGHVGNAIVHACAEVPLSGLISSEFFLTPNVSLSNQATIEVLSRAASACRMTNNSFNREQLVNCLAFRAAVPDIKALLLYIDFRRSRRGDMNITSWAHMWPTTTWDIIGVPTSEPQFVRRVDAPWCFMLCPRKGGMRVDVGDDDTNLFEVYLKLPEDDMEALCSDKFGWLEVVEERSGGRKWLD